MQRQIVCSREKKTLEKLVGEYHPKGEFYDIVSSNAHRIIENGFTSAIDVCGDGNCLIYAIIVYLRYTRSLDAFVNTLLPFCDEIALELLIHSPDELLKNATHMKHIANQVRDHIVLKWDYKGVPDYHMNDRAIDGSAREMTMRLLGVDKLTCYSLCPETNEQYIRITTIQPNKPNLRPDIEHKWQVNLLCQSSFTHYSALLR